MKKNKVKYSIIALLILAIAVFMIAGTYSRYASIGQADANVQVAKWAVAITADNGNKDLTQYQTQTQDITFVVEPNANVVAGKVAPSTKATATAELDLTGTEVAVDFTATIDESQISGLPSYDKLVLTTKMGDTVLTSGKPQLIELENNSAFTAANGKKTITLTLEWKNDDENNADDTQMGVDAGTIVVPVTFEARQHLVTNVSSNNINDIQTALSNVAQGETLKLQNDLDLTEYTRIDGGTPGHMLNFPDNATLDLNGKTITTRNLAVSYQGDNLTIQNGTLLAEPINAQTTGKGSYALFLWDNDNTSHGITVKNITTDGGINAYNAFDIVLEDCDVTATNYYAVYGNAGTSFTINSGTYRGNGSSTLFGFAVPDSSDIAAGITETSSCIINGGTFYTNGKALCLTSGHVAPVIYGGSFDQDVSTYCATGYVCEKNNETGMWDVRAQ